MHGNPNDTVSNDRRPFLRRKIDIVPAKRTRRAVGDVALYDTLCLLTISFSFIFYFFYLFIFFRFIISTITLSYLFPFSFSKRSKLGKGMQGCERYESSMHSTQQRETRVLRESTGGYYKSWAYEYVIKTESRIESLVFDHLP